MWIERWETPNSGFFTDIKINSKDEIVIAGVVSGNIDLDPKEGEQLIEAKNIGALNLYILKLSEEGDYIWSQDYGFTYGRISIDDNDNILVNGSYDRQIEEVINGNINVIEFNGFTDGYVMKVLDENSTKTTKKQLQNINMFPNPLSGDKQLSIDIENEMQYKIISLNGNIIETGTIRPNQILNLGKLGSGYYYIQTFNDRAEAFQKLLIFD